MGRGLEGVGGGVQKLPGHRDRVSCPSGRADGGSILTPFRSLLLVLLESHAEECSMTAASATLNALL